MAVEWSKRNTTKSLQPCKTFGGQLIGPLLTHPPQRDELEVTVFGPGVGESILVHCGDGQWISINSALDRGRCWAMRYLIDIGVCLADGLRLIVCTHWHSDHVGGLAELVENCPNARFVCSSALRSDEFKSVVARFSKIDGFGAINLSLREIRKVFEILGRRNQNGGLPTTLAKAHLGLDAFNAAGIDVRIEALSPSDQDVNSALEIICGIFCSFVRSRDGFVTDRSKSRLGSDPHPSWPRRYIVGGRPGAIGVSLKRLECCRGIRHSTPNKS